MNGNGTQRREGINIPEATMVSKLLDAWVAPPSASVAPPAPPVETVVPQQDAHDETPDGQWIASGSFDKIWSVESGERWCLGLLGLAEVRFLGSSFFVFFLIPVGDSGSVPSGYIQTKADVSHTDGTREGDELVFFYTFNT